MIRQRLVSAALKIAQKMANGFAKNIQDFAAKLVTLIINRKLKHLLKQKLSSIFPPE